MNTVRAESSEVARGSQKVARAFGALGATALSTALLIMGSRYLSSHNDVPADTYTTEYTDAGECLHGTAYDIDRGAVTVETDKGTLTVTPSGSNLFSANFLQFVIKDEGIQLKASDAPTAAVLEQYHCG